MLRAERRSRTGLRRASFFGVSRHLIFLLVLGTAGCGGTTTGTVTPSTPTSPGSVPSPTATNTAVLSWDANSDTDLAGYRVYYGTSPGAYLQPRGQGIVVTRTTFTVTNLDHGVRYYFAVTAFDGSSNESNYSTEVFKDIP